jgi:Putative beta-barrel porin-2, OmpL-like. bbp2
MRARCLVSMLTALALSAAAASACGRPPDPQGAAVRATAPGGPDASSAVDPVAVAGETAQQPDPSGGDRPQSRQPDGDAPPKITYGGNAEIYYSANLNHPFNARNGLHYPEVTDEHGPHLSSVNLWAEGPRTPVGFRVDLGYDRSVLLGHFREPFRSHFIHHVQQAYVSANLNKSGSTYVDLGQWNSPASVLFFTAPIYHLGARIYHYFNDTDYLMAGVHRGWDGTGEPQHSPGLILSGRETLNRRWRLSSTYVGGDEGNGAGGSSWRHLLNVTANWNRDTRWAHSFEADYGQQAGVAVAPRNPRTTHWYGAMVASQYALDAKQSVAATAEWYREDSGFLIGFRGSMTSLAASYTRVVSDHLQLQYEYRHDFAAGGKPFADRARGTFTGQQGTFVVSAIVTF